MRRFTRLRRTVITAATLSATAAAVFATSVHAEAAPSLYINHKHTTVTTHLKNLGIDVVFTTTERTKAESMPPFALESKIEPAQTRAAWRLADLRIATLQIKMIPDGPATGNATPTGQGPMDVKVTQKLDIQIQRIEPLGIKEFNLVGAPCTTSTPAELVLTGQIPFSEDEGTDFFAPLTLKGDLTIPPLAGCGALTPLLNPIASGPGNAVTVELKE
ncbi:Uncharacterised protein [Mycobacteroides abscessus subsp. abscessus]|nr:Uncharacterised protein [Mycobacteroides abscessus subsp. abscessus]